MRPDNSANYLVPYDEQLANRAKKIRCRRCGQRSHEGLTICPSCGRSLRAAISRWITWGVPLAVIALLFASVWGISGRSPIAWVMEFPQSVGSMVTNLGVLIEPRVMAPEAVLNQQATAEQSAILAGASGAVAVVTALPAEPLALALVPEEAPSEPLAVQNASDSLISDGQSDGQSDGDVQSSDPALEPISTSQPTSTSVSLPPATSTAIVQTATESERLTATDLPAPTAEPTTEPTIVPTATAIQQVEYRSDPLVLEAPAIGATLECAQENLLSWKEPISTVATDQYILNLGYVSGQSADQFIVTWIAKQKFTVDETSWTIDPAYCKLAPDEFDNQWIWYMQVIDEDDKIVSAPSSTSYFVWRKP